MMRALFDASESVPALIANLNLIGLILAAGAAAMSRFATGLPARLRYVVAIAAFLAAAIVPFAATWQGADRPQDKPDLVMTGIAAAPASAGRASGVGAVVLPHAPIGELALLVVWVAGAAALLLRDVGRALAFRRKQVEWRRASEDTAETAVVPVYLSSSDGPAAVGIWRPAIVLPEIWFAALSPEARARIMRHELAHIWWRDVPVSAAICVVRALLWPSAALWWLAGLIRTEREIAADEAAVAAGAGAIEYAGELLAAAEFASGTEPVVGAFGFGSVLRRRVSHLLSARRTISASVIVAIGAASAVALAGFTAPVLVPQRWPAPSLSVPADASDGYRHAAVALNAIFARTRPRDFSDDKIVRGHLAAIREAGTIAPIADALGDRNPLAREAAAWIAGLLGDAALVPALTARLHDGEGDVRRAAAWSLAQLKRGKTKGEARP